jgi:hypothetical protein
MGSLQKSISICRPANLHTKICLKKKEKYTYHVIKQCTEKETTSFSNFLLIIKLNYLHDLKIMFQCLLHIITHFIEIMPNLHV